MKPKLATKKIGLFHIEAIMKSNMSKLALPGTFSNLLLSFNTELPIYPRFIKNQ